MDFPFGPFSFSTRRRRIYRFVVDFDDHVNSPNRNRGPTPIGGLEPHACYTFYDAHTRVVSRINNDAGSTKNNNIAHVSSYDIFALHHFTTSWEEPRRRETFGYRGAHLRSWDRCASSDAQSGGRGPLNGDPAMYLHIRDRVLNSAIRVVLYWWKSIPKTDPFVRNVESSDIKNCYR